MGEGDRRAERHGQAYPDYLMQFIGLIFPKDAGAPRQRICFGEPIPMTAGKTAWHVLGARFRLLPPIHTFEVVRYTSYFTKSDRLHFSILARLIEKWLYARIKKDVPPAQQDRVWMMTFIEAEACSVHDTHGRSRLDMN